MLGSCHRSKTYFNASPGHWCFSEYLYNITHVLCLILRDCDVDATRHPHLPGVPAPVQPPADASPSIAYHAGLSSSSTGSQPAGPSIHTRTALVRAPPWPSLPVFLLACLLACLHACLPASVPAFLNACQPGCLPACVPVGQCASVRACLPVWLPACLPTFLPVRVPVRWHLCLWYTCTCVFGTRACVSSVPVHVCLWMGASLTGDVSLPNAAVSLAFARSRSPARPRSTPAHAVG